MNRTNAHPRSTTRAIMIGMACAWGAGLAHAQDATRQVPAAAALQQQQQQQQGGGGGNSLLRVGVALTPPPAPSIDTVPGSAEQSRISAVSLMAVPPPQPRMLKKHDLIQIIIRESTQASSKGNTDAKKETSLDAHLDNYLKLTKQFQVEGVVPTTPLALIGAANTEFKGDATSVREDSYVTRIGAEVIDVKPNGTLVIQARKHFKLDEEEQDYILSGVCRVDDIGPDNTVLSTQLHDMDLTETTKGIVSDTNDRGFLTKLLAKLNPF